MSPAAVQCVSSPSADRILVGVRLRPDGVSAWQVDETSGSITLNNAANHNNQTHPSSTASSSALSPIGGVDTGTSSCGVQWSFDAVFDAGSSSEAVYDRLVLPVLQSSLCGMNGTCFAYGQTSSGKSHTMAAMLRMAANTLFSGDGQPARVALSYFEIYNEQIRDLQHCTQQTQLTHSHQQQQQQQQQRPHQSTAGSDAPRLRVRQHPMYGVYIAGLTETEVANSGGLMAVVAAAEARRAVASTAMNSQSSRAHTICRFTLTTTGAAGERRQSVFQIIDLAGSERCSLSQTSGVRLKEGGHINKSLLELSTVMSKLSQQQQHQQQQSHTQSSGTDSGNGSTDAATGHISHIPYRNSILTRVLEPALGGNSRTAIVACINAVITHRHTHIAAPHSTTQTQPIVYSHLSFYAGAVLVCADGVCLDRSVRPARGRDHQHTAVRTNSQAYNQQSQNQQSNHTRPQPTAK